MSKSESTLPQLPDAVGQGAAAAHPSDPAKGKHLAEMPGIDVEVGLANVGGRRGLYRRVLRQFGDTHARDFVFRLREAMAAEDWAGAVREAHSLKGVARTVGALEAARLAGDIESLLQQRDFEAVEARLMLIAAALEAMRPALSALDSALGG